MNPKQAEWVRLNVLPPMRRHPDEVEELRTCLCQAPPSEWLWGVDQPAARLWNRDGMPLAWGAAGDATNFLGSGHLVQVWHTDRTCTRRRPISA